MSFDDVIAFSGLCCFVAGVYLWLGLPAALIVLGTCLIFIGIRLPDRKSLNERLERIKEIEALQRAGRL